MNLSDKVAQVSPSTWRNSFLPPGKNYVLINLSKYGDEYDDVLNILQNKNCSTVRVQKIERVQHPFAYGSFLLRKKQLNLQNCYTEPRYVMIQIPKSKVPVALEYNLDRRRTSFQSSELRNSNESIIIAKCLRSSYCQIQRDSEIYPEYVVHYI